MAIEFLPTCFRRSIERLPYLPGAGGPHRPLASVEGKTRVFPIQFTVIQHAAAFALQIIQQLLILDVQDLYRKYASPVPHETLVFSVVSGDIVEIVGV